MSGAMVGRALRVGFVPAMLLVMIVVLILRDQPGGDRIQREIYALGTLVTLTARTEGTDAQTVNEAMGRAVTALQDFQRRWTPDGSGLLGGFNTRLQSSSNPPIPPPLLPLIAQSRDWALASQGSFDPGIATLVRAWGFDDPENFRSTPLPAEQIAALLAQPHRLSETRIDNGRLIVPETGLRLDFGAAAKGTAVDEALDLLRAAGVQHAMVNTGGDLKVLGDGGGRPWRIAIRHPRPAGQQRVLAAVQLASGEAMFTSGDYERFFEFEGRRYHHLIDPRTGLPATQAQSVTVIDGNAAKADAAATALFVGGPDKLFELAAALDLQYALLIDAGGRAHCLPAMCERLEWLAEVEMAAATQR